MNKGPDIVFKTDEEQNPVKTSATLFAKLSRSEVLAATLLPNPQMF